MNMNDLKHQCSNNIIYYFPAVEDHHEKLHEQLRQTNIVRSRVPRFTPWIPMGFQSDRLSSPEKIRRSLQKWLETMTAVCSPQFHY